MTHSEIAHLHSFSTLTEWSSDDEIFIKNVQEGNVVRVASKEGDEVEMVDGGKRVMAVWWVLRRFPESLRTRVFLDLLQGNDEDDIWLWKDGDESLIGDVYLHPHPPWTKASAALEKRLSKTRRSATAFASELLAPEEFRPRRYSEFRRGHVLPGSRLSSSRLQIIHTRRMAIYAGPAFSRVKDDIVHLGYCCRACIARCSQPASMWTPSPALVALRHMWDEITAHTDRDFSKWLSDQDSDLILHFQQADEILRQQSQGDPHRRYLPYVNGYPAALREPVTRYTLEEWRSMDAYVVWAVSNRSALDVRAWLGAMLFATCSWALRRLVFLPPPKPAIAFQDAIQTSGHKCWSNDEMDDYNSAMSFLGRTSKAVGITSRYGSRCKPCESEKKLDQFKMRISVDDTVVLEALANECDRRGLSWTKGLRDLLEYMTHPVVGVNPTIPPAQPEHSNQLLSQANIVFPSVDVGLVMEDNHHYQAAEPAHLQHSLDNIISNDPAQYGTNLPSIVLPPSYHEAGSHNYRYQDGQNWSGVSTPTRSNAYNPDDTANETQISTDPISLASKPKMIEEIKSFFIRQLEFHNAHPARTQHGRPKLPWLDFEATLVEEGLKIFNWPEGIARPGKGISADPNKGIAGINIRDLKAIYRAIHNRTNPLSIRRVRDIGTSKRSDSTSPGDSKRGGDSDNDNHRPTKRPRFGDLLLFDSF
ncbi:hypothetical protein C8J56DRAFT_946386 [Mycena floridula]|nr:hypothetical protein C8J56DRAFT_946386 [Mycena floridula]